MGRRFISFLGFAKILLKLPAQYFIIVVPIDGGLLRARGSDNWSSGSVVIFEVGVVDVCVHHNFEVAFLTKRGSSAVRLHGLRIKPSASKAAALSSQGTWPEEHAWCADRA